MRNQPPEFAQVVLDSLTAHIAVLDMDGKIIGVNQPWRRFASANQGEAEHSYLGENYLAVCEKAFEASGDPTISAISVGLRQVLQHRSDHFTFEYPCHSPDEERWFILRITPCSIGGASRAVVSHEDITSRKKAEIALARAERTIRTILETLPVGVWVIDLLGRVVHGNAAGKRIWAGANEPKSREVPPVEGAWFGSGQSVAPAEWSVERVIAKGESLTDQEISIICRDDSKKILLHSAVPIREADGSVSGAIIVNQDITVRHQIQAALVAAQTESERVNRELQQALQRERTVAQTDELTGLFNRRHFFATGRSHFELAARHGKPLSVIMFDIDHFKLINDRFGHDVGDAALRHVARLASEHVRSTDVFARYGGEEFIMLLPETRADSALMLAERIRQAIGGSRIETEQGPLAMTISAGVAESAGPPETLETLMKHADQALYAAKNGGRNHCALFQPTSPLLGMPPLTKQRFQKTSGV